MSVCVCVYIYNNKFWYLICFLPCVVFNVGHKFCPQFIFGYTTVCSFSNYCYYSITKFIRL